MDYLLEGEQTKRLSFRKLHPNDFRLWLPFHEEPLSSQYWEGLPEDPKTACQQQFDRIFERYHTSQGGMNALVCNETQKFIGLCGLLVQTVDELKELEIGYSILPEHWGKGYATEAAELCKKTAFNNDWTAHLISIIHVDNVPSRKVALKIGMQWHRTTTYNKNPVDIYQIKK
jgi:RimJ/RimL family protein N-acetyltransferase